MEKKEVIKKLILIFFFALVIRIGFILTLDNTVDVWGDWWDELGWKIATGQGYWINNPYFTDGKLFYSWRAPGFPLLLAGIYKIFGHNYLAAKICLAILSSFSCLLLFAITSLLAGDKKIGTWAAFIYAIYPSSIFWTGYLAPVTLEIFILLSVVLLLLKAEQKNYFWFMLAGIFTGLGVLTRSIFILLLLVVLIWMTIKNRKIFLSYFIIYTTAVTITISPWVIRNYLIHKTFVLTSTEGGIVCYIANNEKSIYQPSGYWDPTGRYEEHIMKEIKGLSEVETDRYFYRAAFRFIKDNPRIYWKLVKDRFFRFWKVVPHTFSGPGGSYKSYHIKIALLSNLPIFILAAIGFLLSLKKWNNFLLFYLIIIFWAAPIILFFKTVIRYREPIMPFLVMFAVFLINKCLNIKKES